MLIIALEALQLQYQKHSYVNYYTKFVGLSQSTDNYMVNLFFSSGYTLSPYGSYKPPFSCSIPSGMTLVSSGQFHWSHCDTNTCPILDMCPYSNMSSGTNYQTQAVSYVVCVHPIYILILSPSRHINQIQVYYYHHQISK